jgi:hypothetical protein
MQMDNNKVGVGDTSDNNQSCTFHFIVNKTKLDFESLASVAQFTGQFGARIDTE